MDFIDYDTFQGNTSYNGDVQTSLPEPAPPLMLPLNPNLTAKFKGLSLLRKKADEPAVQPVTAETDSFNISTRTAEKYARLSLQLLENSDEPSGNGLLGDIAASKGSLNEHFTKPANQRQDTVLSKKLSNILNNYGSNEFSLREALSILQQKQELDLGGLIRSDMLGSINRRRFRSDIEGELLREHTSVLREFQPIVQKVENLGHRIDKLNKLNVELSENQAIDPAVIDQIQKLSAEKNLLVLKKSILNSFKKNFALTQYEEHYLSNEDISMEYFQILHKCKTIHSNCSVLLTLQNPTLGMKIMEKMSKFLDMSYQRISFFLSAQLERAMSIDSRYTDPSLRPSAPELRLMKISIFYLTNNLKYFDEITNKLIQSRSKTIVEDFLYQSNNADTFDNSRPIILSAHDPLRYIGDILAFVHSSIVNEVELIASLFELGDDEEYEPSEFEKQLIKLENLEGVNKSVKTTTEKIVGSLSRPLKTRVEQVIRSEKRVDVLEKIFGLLDLYKVMYAKQLGQYSQCSILETLNTLKSLCVERVFGSLKENQAIMEKVFESEDWRLEDESLLPPDWLRECLSDTLSILEESSSLGGDNRVMQLDDHAFNNLCDIIIGGPCEMVSKQASKNFSSNKISLYIFKLNCYDLISSKIMVVPSLSLRFEALKGDIDTLQQCLVEEQYTLLLKDAGLDIHQQLIQLVFPLEQIESDEDYFMYHSLIENKLFGKEKLQEVELQLHEFLPSALVDIQQAVFNISSASIANNVITGSSMKFIKLYDVFYKIVRMLYEDDEDDILEFTAFDVATLLGVGDLYKY